MSELTINVASAHADYVPNSVDYDISRELFRATLHDHTVAISLGADDSAFLWWTDGINEWLEHYERLSQALARFAVLEHCSENAWRVVFDTEPKHFAGQFYGFAIGTTA